MRTQTHARDEGRLRCSRCVNKFMINVGAGGAIGQSDPKGHGQTERCRAAVFVNDDSSGTGTSQRKTHEERLALPLEDRSSAAHRAVPP